MAVGFSLVWFGLLTVSFVWLAMAADTFRNDLAGQPVRPSRSVAAGR